MLTTDSPVPENAVPADTASAAVAPGVMLCIASGQSLPNVLPLQVRAWDRLVIYASRDMRAAAQRLELVAGVMRRMRGHPASDCCEIVALPEDRSYRSLATFAAQEVERLSGVYPRHRLSFNATGGQKTMTLAFAQALRGRADIFYCQTERDCIEQIEPLGPDQALPAALLDLYAYLSVQGYVIKGCVPLDDARALEDVRRRARLTSTLVHKVGELRRQFPDVPSTFPKGSPRSVLGALHGAAVAACEATHQTRAMPFPARQPLALPGESDWWAVLLDEATSCGVLQTWTREGNDIVLTFSDHNAAAYLAGGYLEEYVHLAVHALGLPPGAAARGVHMDLLERHRERDGRDFNELDIAITWRNRLLILECKAGRQLLDPGKSQDILNKLGLLKSQVGGNYGHAWVLTTAKVDEQYHAHILERARTAQLEVVDGPKLRNLPQRLAQALDWPRPPAADWIEPPLSLRKTGTAAAR
jgi:Domain of unknown function (DUF1887).